MLSPRSVHQRAGEGTPVGRSAAATSAPAVLCPPAQRQRRGRRARRTRAGNTPHPPPSSPTLAAARVRPRGALRVSSRLRESGRLAAARGFVVVMVIVHTSAVNAFSTFSTARVPPSSSPPDVATAVNRALTSVHRALKRPTNASTLSLGAASAARSSRLPQVTPRRPFKWGGAIEARYTPRPNYWFVGVYMRSTGRVQQPMYDTPSTGDREPEDRVPRPHSSCKAARTGVRGPPGAPPPPPLNARATTPRRSHRVSCEKWHIPAGAHMAAAGAPLGPGDLGMVYGCLTAALNADPATRQPAEAALQALEARGGFCSCLLVSPTWNASSKSRCGTFGCGASCVLAPHWLREDVLGFWQRVGSSAVDQGCEGTLGMQWSLCCSAPTHAGRCGGPSPPCAPTPPIGRRKNDLGGTGERRRR